MDVIGLFSELEPGHPHLRSIRDFVGQLTEADQQLVLKYLDDNAGMVMCWMGLTRDPLSPEGRRVYGPSVCSDGRWIWREDLRYFVGQYRIGLPEAFLEHVRSAGGVFSTPDEELRVKFDQIMATYERAERHGEALGY
ncbi:hypothetical protein [Deinococcus ficus]|uniref:Uncharacterized protein n=1 Tax=Deinococcus ficus TaxID=317577 RepID=A0A221T361_9DEIO|nr:hypothetical protein [Deinococcus ficus]ASN83348.1 hypothetical protein DFI_19310 [Deinococcus ficus]